MALYRDGDGAQDWGRSGAWRDLGLRFWGLGFWFQGLGFVFGVHGFVFRV